MGVISTTADFTDGEQVTSGKLDEIQGGSSFSPSAIVGTTLVIDPSGGLKVGVLDQTNIGAGAITPTQLAGDSVTDAAIAPGAVSEDELAADSVTNTKIKNGEVPFTKLAPAALATRAQMQAQTGSLIPTPDVLKDHPGIAKAYATVNYANGDAALTGSFNVASATDTGTSRAITLGITMADKDYIVIPSYVEAAALAAPGVENKTTTGFSIFGPAEAAGRKISFVVYGKQA